MKFKLSTRDLTYMSLMVALISVCAWITVPLAVPFTLQTFAVCACAGLLGARRGTLALLAYVLMGAVGLPVFSGFSGGLGHLVGTTGGYILGYILIQPVVGLLTRRFGHSFPVLFFSMIAGLVTCYFFGTVWFILVYLKTTGPIALTTALGWCVFPFILPDLIKLGIAAAFVRRLQSIPALNF